MTQPQAPVRWGVLGVARIATHKVIPAMQRGDRSLVAAIASRDAARARAAADALGIGIAHRSYEALIADPTIEAIYNPLPNHLHVPWTIRAAEAGKHVLCEKPIAITADEAERLIEVRDRHGVLVQEAVMIRTAPQWQRVMDLLRGGRIGTLRAVGGCFSYFNEDPANVRNVVEFGGGALLDIGCYLVHVARMLFEREPGRVSALIDRDPRFGVDRLCSMMLDFGDGQAIGTCGTQVAPYQRVQVLGTGGRIEVEIPFNAPPDRPCRLNVYEGTEPIVGALETIEIEPSNQYTVQGDLFSRAIRERTAAPYPLEDSVLTLRVIDALFESARTGAACRP
jgi:predicted dehydrogenase